MSSSTPLHSLSLPLSIFFIFLISSFVAPATVPPSKTFRYVNEGEFGEYIVDRSESTMRWVWDANRGNPVHDNATLTFGRDGNLVLADADADGRVAWQTGTANKGVVDLKLLQNGNLVLLDKLRKFVWQSFDYPTDTLLIGQVLLPGGPNKLVSRVSSVDGSAGPYSFVVEQRRLAMYLNSKNSPKPLLYYASDEFGNGQGSLAHFVFQSEPVTDEAYAYELRFMYDMNNSTNSGTYILARPKYNSTYSMLRVDFDGNLRIYTFYDKVDWGAWEVTFNLFDRDGSEWRLPKRCGSLGVCEDDQCVACPMPQGLLGWSKNCAAPMLSVCKKGANVDYYKVVGVEHFMNAYTEGDGPMKIAECRERCSKDCGCLGFFYREESSKCLLAPELGTLAKVSNSSHQLSSFTRIKLTFDNPTDILFMDQEVLRPGAPNILVSKVSNVDGFEGPHSFVMEQKQLAM
ncbi:hypothetical protein HHK36_001739 [Tetracentron sinense]|uniref:Uncharacterized protein n=1 Tax=Tetracentron sinense TaxID=13715 RepID=A0A835DRW7_TETSI|nr:hypothetical protein HHK36_001739 [Tetracentron sinense]